jgi:antitoxin HigA-1
MPDDVDYHDSTDTAMRTAKAPRMHNPPHPGEILRDSILGEDGLSVSEFAKRLGVSRVALSRVVNARAAVSADMALRLAAARGGSAQSWLHMQVSYDPWQASRKRRPKVEPIKRAARDRAKSPWRPAL